MFFASEKIWYVLLKHPLQVLTAEMRIYRRPTSTSVAKVEISRTSDVMKGN